MTINHRTRCFKSELKDQWNGKRAGTLKHASREVRVMHFITVAVLEYTVVKERKLTR